MNLNLEPGWARALKKEFESEWFKELINFIECERAAGKVIYPAQEDIFQAFNATSFDKTKVVILGQDPYHGLGQAQGLSFSVPAAIKNPPSLVNIFKEIESDLGEKARSETEAGGDLSDWAKQGVLLLNTSLTVEFHKAASHSGKGWENLTDAVIKKLSNEREGLVFMLWGNHARSKKTLIDEAKHLVLEAPHPSPLSARKGFFGCKHFSSCSQYLGDRSITW